MRNIVVYTTPEKLLHKQGKLPNDHDHSEDGEYFWEFGHLPKEPWAADRIYFATQGFVRGYFRIIECSRKTHEVYWDCKTWVDVPPVPTHSFQGFKYVWFVECEEVNE